MHIVLGVSSQKIARSFRRLQQSPLRGAARRGAGDPDPDDFAKPGWLMSKTWHLYGNILVNDGWLMMIIVDYRDIVDVWIQ